MFKLSENADENKARLNGAQVAILGAARSGIAVSQLVAAAGASVLLSDVKSAMELNLPHHKLKNAGVKVETGGHSDNVLKSDLICISPGIPLTIPILQKAVEKGIPVVGELEAAYWFCRAPVIGITGSNGKTTTTTLAGEILKSTISQTVVAGNIGKPFAEQVAHTAAEGIALLEISSFQLETIHSFHPRIAVVMNLTANHLDRYPDFRSYAAAKLNILKNMTGNDLLIYNKDDPFLKENLSEVGLPKFVFSLHPHCQQGVYWENQGMVVQIDSECRHISLKGALLKGLHNRYNMMVAALLGVLKGIPENLIAEKITAFQGIEHRLELVRTLNGISFVNDSKATTVDSLSYALPSFGQKVVLIAGGKDKGGDYSRLNNLLKKHAKMAVLIGEAADKMEKAWKNALPVEKAVTLEKAVRIAYQHAGNGDVVLLSPACSSFDMFADYEDRGKKFKTMVKGLES